MPLIIPANDNNDNMIVICYGVAGKGKWVGLVFCRLIGLVSHYRKPQNRISKV